MKLNIFTFTFLLILLSNCGFEVINKRDLIKFSINDVQTSGDQKINYKLKNNLLVYANENLPNSIELYIETIKNRKIKDKNNKNEIITYQIDLISKIKMTIINENKNFVFTISRSGDYSVGERNTLTLVNMKRTEQTLINEITDDILNKLISIINDL